MLNTTYNKHSDSCNKQLQPRATGALHWARDVTRGGLERAPMIRTSPVLCEQHETADQGSQQQAEADH